MLTRHWQILWVEETRKLTIFKGNQNQNEEKIGRPRIPVLIKEERGVHPTQNTRHTGLKINLFCFKNKHKKKKGVTKT